MHPRRNRCGTRSKFAPSSARGIRRSSTSFRAAFGPIEFRPVDPIDIAQPEIRPRSRLAWMRSRDKLPDDYRLHQCVLAYLSDWSLLDTATLPHGISYLNETMQMASLDHAMWFHRPFPRGRVAALRAGQPFGERCPRFQSRLDLLCRRAAGGFSRAGGAHSRVGVTRGDWHASNGVKQMSARLAGTFLPPVCSHAQSSSCRPAPRLTSPIQPPHLVHFFVPGAAQPWHQTSVECWGSPSSRCSSHNALILTQLLVGAEIRQRHRITCQER